MSGAVYNAYGWDMLNWVVFPICVICLGALATLSMARSRQAT